jgi:uncharacterized protein (TIGR03084 family)
MVDAADVLADLVAQPSDVDSRVAVLADADRATAERIPWYATAMTPASLATARLMQTWAHGLDVADALGILSAPTARLRDIAFFGHRTSGYAFLIHGWPARTAGVRVVLDAPGGTQWTFGPEDASDRVTGPALDFCYLVTQRRHRDDLALGAPA